MAGRRLSVAERLEKYSRADPVTGCRLWCGKSRIRQYGRLKIDGKHVLAHRAAWEEVNGPIPEGVKCLHDCPAGDEPSCIEVTHLFLGSQAENVADMVAKGRNRGPNNKGVAHGLAKLDDDSVRAIRNDERPYRIVGADFDVSAATVCRVKAGDGWAHVV